MRLACSSGPARSHGPPRGATAGTVHRNGGTGERGSDHDSRTLPTALCPHPVLPIVPRASPASSLRIRQNRPTSCIPGQAWIGWAGFRPSLVCSSASSPCSPPMTTSPPSAAASTSSSNGASFSSLPRWRQWLSMLNWRRDPDFETRMLALRSEIEQLEAESARWNALNASIQRLCFPPESSSTPPPATEPDCGPSSP